MGVRSEAGRKYKVRELVRAKEDKGRVGEKFLKNTEKKCYIKEAKGLKLILSYAG